MHAETYGSFLPGLVCFRGTFEPDTRNCCKMGLAEGASRVFARGFV